MDRTLAIEFTSRQWLLVRCGKGELLRQHLQMELRVQKEAEFHNSAYEEGLRRGVSKYYEVMRESQDFYRNYLKAHCQSGHVLEYGCGQNSLARFLAGSGAARVTGIDISEVAVRQVREQARSAGCDIAEYQVMNAETLEFPEATFDLICGVAILHHLDLRKAFSEVARTLKPGGSAIFREPLAHNPVFNLYRRLTPRLRTEDEHPLTMRDLEMASRYFEKVEVRYFHCFVLLAAPFARYLIFDRLLKSLESIDRLLFKSLPFFRRFAWSVSIVLSGPRWPAARAVFQE